MLRKKSLRPNSGSPTLPCCNSTTIGKMYRHLSCSCSTLERCLYDLPTVVLLQKGIIRLVMQSTVGAGSLTLPVDNSTTVGRIVQTCPAICGCSNLETCLYIVPPAVLLKKGIIRLAMCMSLTVDAGSLTLPVSILPCRQLLRQSTDVLEYAASAGADGAAASCHLACQA